MPVRTELQRRETITWAANSSSSTQLKVRGLIRGLFLELTGTLNVTGAMTAAVAQNPGTLVPSFTVRKNGKVLKQGRWIDWLTRMYAYGYKLPAETAAAAGVAAYPFRSRIYVPFITPHARRPVDTVLFIGQGDRLDIDITFGDVNSLGTGGTKTFTVTPQVNIVVDEMTGNIAPIGVFKELNFEDSVGTTANTNYQGAQMPVSPVIQYHSLLVQCEDNVANSLRTLESFINDLTLQTQGEGGTEQPYGIISGGQNQNMVNVVQNMVDAVRVGVYPVLFQPYYEGLMTYNLRGAGLTDLRFLIDHAAPTTAGFVRVLTNTIEPVI